MTNRPNYEVRTTCESCAFAVHDNPKIYCNYDLDMPFKKGKTGSIFSKLYKKWAKEHTVQSQGSCDYAPSQALTQPKKVKKPAPPLSPFRQQTLIEAAHLQSSAAMAKEIVESVIGRKFDDDKETSNG